LIKAGCCGFAVQGGINAYYKKFSLVELQSTFYKLPRLETAKKWRKAAPEGFEFTLKAFQAITHPVTSPTWRKAGVKVPLERAERYGFLKPTDENIEAWESTRRIAEVLEAKVVVVQCPPTFIYSVATVTDINGFFNSINRDGLEIAWEPRNPSWLPEIVKILCDKLNLVHVVDPFKERTVTAYRELIYYRLHGLGKRMYVYKYTDEDHRRLYTEFVEPYTQYGKEVYILWNNVAMAEDAERFQKLISKKYSEQLSCSQHGLT